MCSKNLGQNAENSFTSCNASLVTKGIKAYQAIKFSPLETYYALFTWLLARISDLENCAANNSFTADSLLTANLAKIPRGRCDDGEKWSTTANKCVRTVQNLVSNKTVYHGTPFNS